MADNTTSAADKARDFLRAIYGSENQIWTCGFRDIASGDWTGAMGVERLERFGSTEGDFYFCIGVMDPNAPQRGNGHVIRQRLIIADDIGTKANKDVWAGMLALGFPAPTFQIETSPGNETWGWVLNDAVERDDADGWADIARIRAWLTAKVLTDPGVADPARYIRFPFGWNSKDKYRDPATGAKPRVHLVDFDFSQRVSLEDFGRALHFGDANWRDIPLPPAAMGAADLSRMGAIRRKADLNNPEPLMVLWQELGGNLRQV
ncbi:AAA family ATPase, partial [Aduncisulcus paluster]